MTNQDFYNILKAEKERLMNESKLAFNDCQVKRGEMAKTWNIVNALEEAGKFGTQELSDAYDAYEKASHASMLADNYLDDIDEAIDKINELISLYAD
jgi:proline dehydrogenase